MSKTGFERYPELYGSRQWKFLRLQVFDRDEYTCKICDHPTTKPHADHIKAHNGDRELFFDEDNLQTLCPACHNYKRRQDNGKILPGCDVNGMPIDQRHNWNKQTERS